MSRPRRILRDRDFDFPAAIISRSPVVPAQNPVTSPAVPIRHVRRLRIGGLLIGGAATVSMVIASCTTVTEGDPIVNAGDAPQYRTSVAMSLSQSAASSSERQASLTTQAIHTACETLSSTSSDAIDAVNNYVGAFNQGVGNLASTEVPAINALNQSADATAGSITDAVPQRLKDAFGGWITGARETATAISGHAGPDEFNRTINRINDARSQALKLCDATYR